MDPINLLTPSDQNKFNSSGLSIKLEYKNQTCKNSTLKVFLIICFQIIIFLEKQEINVTLEMNQTKQTRWDIGFLKSRLCKIQPQFCSYSFAHQHLNFV